MRLEERDHAARMAFERPQGRRAFFGIMAEIVDHGHAAGRCADDIEPPRQPLERGQRRNRIGHRHARRIGPGNGGERIGEVVATRQVQRQRVFAAIAPVHDQRRLPGRAIRDATLHHADPGAAIVDAEGQRRVGARDEAEGFLVIGIDHAGRSALQKITEQFAQFVHALVIEADVQQQCHRRAIQRYRSVAFVHLADEGIAPADLGAGEAVVGLAVVLHHRAVHDRRVRARLLHDPAEHSGHRRLAAGPADGDTLRRGVEQFGQQFGAAHPRAAQFLRAHHFGRGVFHGGRGDQHLRFAGDAAAVLRVQLETLRLQPGEFIGRPALIERAVAACNFGSQSLQDRCQRQHSRSADAAKEPGAGGQVGGGIGQVRHVDLQVAQKAMLTTARERR